MSETVRSFNMFFSFSRDVAYGNGLYVVVSSSYPLGDAHGGFLMTSRNAIDWTVHPSFKTTLEGIGYSEGAFVAVKGGDVWTSGNILNGGFDCDPGKYAADTRSVSSQALSQRLCMPCPAGMFSYRGWTRCAPCREGFASGGSMSAQCQPCPAGRYALKGSGECLACPAGKYSDAMAGVCTACTKASYSVEGQSQCNACSSNSQ